MYVLTFSTTFVWNTSHSKNNTSSRKITVIFGFQWNSKFAPQLFKIILKYKISFISTSISPTVQADRHDETNIRFSQFCERG